MKYSILGATEKRVSQIGFGSMRLPGYEKNGEWQLDEEVAVSLVHEAVNLGVNFFDVGYTYGRGQSQKLIGEIVKPYRGKIYLAGKIKPRDLKKQGDLRKILERILDDLQTDHLDFFNFWGISECEADDMNRRRFFSEAVELKSDGLISHIGFSFHDTPNALERIINKYDIMETVMCEYNLLNQNNEIGMEYAKRKGLGVLVMSPAAGGRLFLPSLFSKGKNNNHPNIDYKTAYKYVCANSNVSCVLSGVSSLKMLKENISVLDDVEMTTQDWEQTNFIIKSLKNVSELYCTGCDYCQPCPKRIYIAKYFYIYNLYNVYGLLEAAADDYTRFTKKLKNAQIHECTGCGACIEKCPQNIDIPHKLKYIEKLFHKLQRIAMKKIEKLS